MYFIGIDLAWSTKNGTGVTILEGNKSKAKLVSSDILFSDQDIINYIKNNAKGNAIISIDAPLVVPNQEGRREAERLVGILFRKYNAGAHPSNRKRLSSWTGTIRGEELSKKLEKEGYKHDYNLKKFEESKKFFEVFPHPSIVVLFSLDKIIQYKAKPKRDYEFRWKEFKRYQSYLKSLENSKPALILPDKLIKKDVRKLRAQSLKNYEDILDSIFCAYLSYYAWVNPEKCAVLGDMKQGYILTPIFDFMIKQLKDANNQKTLNDF